MALPHLTSTPRRAAPGAVVVITGPPAAAGTLAARAAAASAAARPGSTVLLADLTRRAVLDAVVACRSGPETLTSVLEASRLGAPAAEALEVAAPPGPAGHRVLRGLAHPLDWTAVRAEAVDRALGALRARSELVIALVDPDLEGEAETGSVDLEDRHALTRWALAHASGVAVAAEPGPVGLDLARRLAAELGAAANEAVPVVVLGPDGTGRGHGCEGSPATIGALVGHALGRPPAAAPWSTEPIRLGELGIRPAAPGS